MKYRAIKTTASNQLFSRNSIAGAPWIRRDSALPICGQCNTPMQLFLQFDIDEKFGMPFKTGSHFVLYMCPHCNEIPTFEEIPGQLPNNFWEKYGSHFYAALYKPEQALESRNSNNLIEEFSLDFRKEINDSYVADAIRLGGDPNWLQSPEPHVCSCGAGLHLICQISENFKFPKIPSAPSQPDSFSSDDYCLFLGNEIYIFGCSEQCNERAVWLTVQN